MTASNETALRRELVARLAEIYRTVRHDVSEAALATAFERDPGDESEEAAVDELQSLQGELGTRDAQLSQAIVAALDRMRSGNYGVCIDCGEPIAIERLHAVPWTERCAVDQSAAEGTTPHATL